MLLFCTVSDAVIRDVCCDLQPCQWVTWYLRKTRMLKKARSALHTRHRTTTLEGPLCLSQPGNKLPVISYIYKFIKFESKIGW